MDCRQIIELEAGLEVMESSITKLKRILEGLPEPPFSLEDYITPYMTTYSMCTQKPPHNYGQELYVNYKTAFDDYLTDTVLKCLMEKDDKYMLRELVRRWSNHKVMIRWLSRFFDYLDRFVSRRRLPSLKDVGLLCFREKVYDEVWRKATNAVIALIDVERDGGQIDRSLLRNVLDIYVEMGMGKMEQYVNDFEVYMLADTVSYYSRKASSWTLEDSFPEYMLKAEECLKKEKDRVGSYLYSSSEEELLEILHHELLAVHESQLLEKENSGCCALLRDDQVEDLSRMYRLYLNIPEGLEPIAAMFKKHIDDEGSALVQQAEYAASIKAENAGRSHEQVFVRKAIELHDKFMAYVNDCFANHTVFHKSLKEAFESFLNTGVAGSSNAELLASFCDNILKKGGIEKLTDEAIEDSLEKVVKLLAYVNDKDLFAEFYRKKLARRLLFNRSANDERSFLTKLRKQCGGQFTSKMEEMVTDLTVAKEFQSQFEEYLADNPNTSRGLDLTVTVLTTGFWPSYKSSDLNLPYEMARCAEAFKQLYQRRAKHRKLTWVYSLGSCNVVGKFDQKPIELIVRTYQAAALMLFNMADRLSYSEISTQLNMADEDLTRVLQSLSCAKYKILTKEPSSRTIYPTDQFVFNAKFTDRMSKIRIALPPMDEQKKVVENVDKDRRYAIDAAIVRIMKTREVLGYKQLVTECVEQLSKVFKPDFVAIKKRLEVLIDRDFLERDKENADVFCYVA